MVEYHEKDRAVNGVGMHRLRAVVTFFLVPAK